MAGSGTAHLRPDALLSVRNMTVEYLTSDGHRVHAVSNVSLDVLSGETVGLVGESGCGKSTTARAIVRHLRPTEGGIYFEGEDIAQTPESDLRTVRRRMQMIFQDPISSLNPRRTIEAIIGEGLRIQGVSSNERSRRVAEVMSAVGLAYAPELKRRRTEFSGGQCQRISIARALILDPEVLVCDEPVSALDVSVQAQVLNLLWDMRERYQLTVLFISHDLSVVKHMSDRIVVMYLGKICEVAAPQDLYQRPQHHYTRLLLDAIPIPDPAKRKHAAQLRSTQQAELPSATEPPSGCRFRTRCHAAREVCALEEPQLREVGTGHYVACHFPLSSSVSNGDGLVHVPDAATSTRAGC